MAEIKIDSNNLENEINKLTALKAKIASANIKCPTVVGGGTSVQQIENIGKKYKLMFSKVESLVDNTISFMKNVNTSYVSSDKNAANSFK